MAFINVIRNVLLLFSLVTPSLSFMIPVVTIPTTTTSKSSSSLYMIDKNVANMIDNEYYRQHHKEEYQREWMNKYKSTITKNINDIKGEQIKEQFDSFSMDNDSIQNVRQQLRDVKLARNNPQQYCADRCIATGYCDVYEDFFDFSPEEVIEFCTNCVLALDEDSECAIPDAFYENTNDTKNTGTNSIQFKP